MLGYLHIAGDSHALSVPRSELVALQQHYMYTESYCKTCLALTIMIAELEGVPVTEELKISALFLRYSPTEKYDIKKNVNIVHEMFASPRVKKLIALQSGVREIDDIEAKILHDAEILTLFAQEPSQLIKMVKDSYNYDDARSAQNLCNVAHSQRMYTKIGAQMLKTAAPNICVRLGEYLDAKAT